LGLLGIGSDRSHREVVCLFAACQAFAKEVDGVLETAQVLDRIGIAVGVLGVIGGGHECRQLVAACWQRWVIAI